MITDLGSIRISPICQWAKCAFPPLFVGVDVLLESAEHELARVKSAYAGNGIRRRDTENDGSTLHKESAVLLGRLEVLLEASGRLGRPECLDRARVIARQVVANANLRGRYPFGIDAGIYVPSFHQGMAGIGYQLLRIADPDRFPSVLSWHSLPGAR